MCSIKIPDRKKIDLVHDKKMQKYHYDRLYTACTVVTTLTGQRYRYLYNMHTFTMFTLMNTHTHTHTHTHTIRLAVF